MDREEALRYATEWAGNWNARDLEAVLAHFDHDAVLSSPKAVPAVGVPTERGRAALLEYWTTALQGIRSLRFSVRWILWDPQTRELSIVYDREIGGQGDRSFQVLRLGGSS